jgi:hypothetical protein
MHRFIQAICNWTTISHFRPHNVFVSGDVLGNVEHFPFTCSRLSCPAKASTAALNKPGFGVNMLGGHFAPWSYSLIPAETESEATYTAAYSASKKVTQKLMRMRLCDKEECFICRTIEQLKKHRPVAACLKGTPYKGPTENCISLHVLETTHSLFKTFPSTRSAWLPMFVRRIHLYICHCCKPWLS